MDILERWWNTYRDDMWSIPPTVFTGIPGPREFIEEGLTDNSKEIVLREKMFNTTLKKRKIAMPYKICEGFIIVDIKALKRPIMTSLKLYMESCCQAVSLSRPRVIIIVNLSCKHTKAVLSLIERYSSSSRFIYLYRDKKNMHPILGCKCQVFNLKGRIFHSMKVMRIDSHLRVLASIKSRADIVEFVNKTMSLCCEMKYTLDKLMLFMGQRLLKVVKDHNSRLILMSAISTCSHDIGKVKNNEVFAVFKLSTTVYENLHK